VATKRTAGSGSGTRKSAANKTAQKTTQKTTKTARKSTKKTASKPARQSTASARSSAGSDAPRAEARQKRTASQIAALAARQLLDLTGREVEGITGLERTDDGWKVQVEVVEVRRIPDTTDVLALYEVEVDGDGELEAYHRLRRYTRGAPGEE